MTLVADLIAGRSEPLLTADAGPVRFVILNRPQVRNALSRQMRRDFSTLLRAADADPAVAVIVLTGADPAFGAGVDLKERASGPPQPPVEPNPGAALRGLAKPSIAAVNGACVTGAMEMALSCGFILASDRAQFADTHARVGLFPRWGQAALLSGAIGVRRARQMMLTGAPIDAATALAWGLANEVVAHAALIDRALALAQAIAAISGAQPLSYGLHLEMLRGLDEAAGGAAGEVERAALCRFDAAVAATVATASERPAP